MTFQGALVALVFCGIAPLCSGCVSRQKVAVEFSPLLKGYFSEVPTIEVDIAAITEADASEVKQAGVEKYFAPNSSLRARLQPQTCFYSEEEDVNFVLPSRAPVWQAWLARKPVNLLVIASLPYDASMDPQTDPRCLIVTMQKSYIIAKTLSVFVEPQKVVRAARKPGAGKHAGEETGPEQWIETRTRRNR